MRIVSLLASGTDLVLALGAGGDLVGRSHECDAPEVAHLPVLSRPAFDVGGTSGEIDARVRARLAARAPLYEVDEAAIARLRPDVVITQTHCEVCAVAPDALAAPARQKVVAFSGGDLAGVLADFRAVAAVIGRADAAARLCAELAAELAAVATAVKGRPGPRVAGIEWLDPLYAMGNWGPALIAHAGGESVLAEPGAHSRRISWDEVRAADPDVLVVAPCGFEIARTEAEMPALAARPGWDALRAVRAGRVFVADGNRHFNRSSPDLFHTVRLLAELLHPGATPPRFAARYRRFPATPT